MTNEELPLERLKAELAALRFDHEKVRIEARDAKRMAELLSQELRDLRTYFKLEYKDPQPRKLGVRRTFRGW